MTDYNQFNDKCDDCEYETRAVDPDNIRTQLEKPIKFPDFSKIEDAKMKWLKAENDRLEANERAKSGERCSTNGSIRVLIQYAKKLNELRKAAAESGVCLDELEEAAKELS